MIRVLVWISYFPHPLFIYYFLLPHPHLPYHDKCHLSTALIFLEYLIQQSFHHQSPVISHQASIINRPSRFIHHSIIRRPSSIIHHQPSIVCHQTPSSESDSRIEISGPSIIHHQSKSLGINIVNLNGTISRFNKSKKCNKH